MEPFLSSYHLPFHDFQALLCSTNSVVAGSCALALYLKQGGVDPGFVPRDMDIWIEDTPMQVSTQGAIHQYSNHHMFLDLLLKNGFYTFSTFEPHSYDSLHGITRILSLRNREKQEIQLIFLNVSDLYHYILHNFDLSICMCWWNADHNLFECMWPEDTMNKEMYYYPARDHTTREGTRIDKYKARGFTLLEWPCAAQGVQDMREDLSVFDGKTAFDLFAYEDVDIVPFLKSSHHVLLHVGEQFYAFHRDTLKKYFEEKRMIHPLGIMVDTPHKQTIPEEAARLLSFSDYTLAALVLEYTLPWSHAQKSVHSVHFYTVAQWTASAAPGAIVEPPEFQSVGAAGRLPLHHPDVYWMDS